MKNNKKICIVTRALINGGAERVIAQLANYFVKNGIECSIITIDVAAVAYELDTRINVDAIGKKADNKVKDRFFRYAALRKKIMRYKPDVVLSMPEDIGIYVILALIGSKIPVCVSERNNPWVMPDVKITRLLRTIASPLADGIIFQTDMAKSYFPKNIQKKGIVLSNPVDIARIPEPYKGIRQNVFVAVGRLERQKNFPMLIKAFSIFYQREKNFKLVIYGEGRERANLESLIKELDLDGVVLLPGRNKDVLNAINDASAFILSSDYEGMPNALIEAMCMGMPVISTDCPSGGPRELIENQENGILIPVGDEDALVDALFSIIDVTLAEKMSKKSSELRYALTSISIFENWEKYLFCE